MKKRERERRFSLELEKDVTILCANVVSYGATFELIRNIYLVNQLVNIEYLMWLLKKFMKKIYDLKTNHKLFYRFDQIISDVKLAMMLLT